jgi:hypothetical protein
MNAVQRRNERSTLVTAPALPHESSGQIVRFPAQQTSKFCWLRTFLLAGFTSISVGAAILWQSFRAEEWIHPSDYVSRTERILTTTPLIDGHNDLPFLLRLQLQNQIYDDNFPFAQSKICYSCF